MIITLGRQHGSNGHDIARALADALGYTCYDKEIVDHAAENSSFSKEILDTYDDKRVSSYIVPTLRSLADKGNAIFVGRCADYVLRNRDDVLRVFIMADMPFRIKTMMTRKNLTEDQAKKLIREVDKDRSSYYKYYTDQIWGESGNYDLCIDTSTCTLDEAAARIADRFRAMA